MEMFIKNPRYVGLKFPEISKPETIERRYLGKLSKKALNFLKLLLKMDPAERPTIQEAMGHPLFDGIRELYNDEEVKPINHAGSSSAVPDENLNIRNSKNALEDRKNEDADERDSQFEKKS